MKLKRIAISISIALLFLTPLVVLASNIDNAQYYGVIKITNNSTATNYVATTCNISTQNLVDGDYLNASANNCAILSSSGGDVYFQPSINSTYPWWSIFVPSIGANSILNDILYTANSTGGWIEYFPGASGMTTPDNDVTLEPGDNFTIEQYGWIDTDNGTDKDLVHKQGACELFVSENVSGNVTFNIGTHGWFSPVGFQDPDTYWGSESLAYDGSLSTNATMNGFVQDVWNSPIILTCNSTYVDRLRFYRASDANDASITSVNLSAYYGAAWHIIHQGAFNHGAWNAYSINSTELVTAMRISYYLTVGSGVAQDMLAEAEFGGGTLTSVTATGVASGNYTVSVTQGPTSGHLWCDPAGGDYVNCGDSANLSAPVMLSIECWMKGTNPSGLSNYKVFASKYLHATAREWVFMTERSGGYDRITFHFYDQSTGANRGGYVPSTDNISIWDGNPHHIAVTWDGDISNPCTGITFYIDGVSANYTDASGGAFTAIEDTTQPVLIGRQDNLNNRDWADYIDSVRIYNRELSAAEVAQHFAGTFTDESSIVGLWHLDELSGLTVFDVSGENNDGTLVGTTISRIATNLSGQTNQALELYIDSVLEDVARSATVPNTSANWTFVKGNAMLWMDYHRIWIGGVLRQDIEWEWNNVFGDASGNSNPATPSWRIGSSDADVSAELISFLPVAEAKAPAYALGEAIPFIDADALTSNLSGATFTTIPPAPAGGFPLAGVITTLADATDTPPQLPLLLIACFVTLAMSLSFSYVMRRFGSGALLIKMLVISAVIGIFCALGNFGLDFWIIFVFLVIGTAICFASKQLSF